MANLQAGQMLGPYRIIEQIGKGGMAVVYKAYHAAMDREVALKILPFQFASTDEFIERFRREVRVIARLEHPRILPVYDSGEYEGVPYLVMRFLDYGTLKDRILAGRLTLEEVDKLFTQLAEALAYAHSMDVIHRDIKPSNVLVSERGDVFLTDFGIAKIVGGATQLTASGAITGTPAYMSPEQAQGESLDARSDIYSLGIVLYEMVTGKVPFEAETPLAIILKHLQDPLPPPSRVMPALHPAIERVILKALSRNREDRFETINDMLAAWKNAVQESQSTVETVKTAALPAPSEQQPAVQTSSQPEISQPPKVSASQAKSRPAQPKPKAKNRRSLIWMISIAVVFVAFVGILVIGVLVRRFLRNRGVAQTTPTVEISGVGSLGGNTPGAGEVLLPSPTIDISANLPPFSRDGTWTSWTAVNNVFDIYAKNGKVYAGNPGTITVWDVQNASFEFVPIDKRVSDPSAYSVYVDHNNDLWAGTGWGLGRYDGNDWVLYDEEDGLENAEIQTMLEVEEILLVGSSYGGDGEGLYLFDGSSWQIFPDFPSTEDETPGSLSSSVTSMLYEPLSDLLLVGTEHGLGVYDGEIWEVYTTDDGLPDNVINTLYVDQDRNLLVGTGMGVGIYDGGSITTIPQLEDEWVDAIIQDSAGRYWFGTWGIWLYDPDTVDWSYFNGETAPYLETNFVDVVEVDGVLYFASLDNGLVRYDGGFELLSVPNMPTREAYWGILPSQGSLWFVESYGEHIDSYNPTSDEWRPLPELPCCASPIAIGPNGLLWAGGDTGLWLLSENSQVNIKAQNGLLSDEVWAVAFEPSTDRVWLGMGGGIVVLQNQQVQEAYRAAELGFSEGEEINVWDLFFATDGSLWAAMDDRVIRRTPEGQWEHFGNGNPFSDGYYLTTGFAETPDGAVWMSTFDDGLWRYSAGDWTHFTPDFSNAPYYSINTVTTGPDGSIWVGAYYDGAGRYDGEKWETFNTEDGLANDNVEAIYLDLTGTIWFATSGGISRYQP